MGAPTATVKKPTKMLDYNARQKQTGLSMIHLLGRYAMSKQFPNYDIDAVIRDAKPYDVLRWFRDNLPAAHEADDALLYLEERIPRDIIDLVIHYWANAFESLIVGCGGVELMYRAQAAMKHLPYIEATAAIDECVAALNTFGFDSYYYLNHEQTEIVDSELQRIDKRYFDDGGLWREGYDELIREVFQFITMHLDVYRRRKEAA